MSCTLSPLHVAMIAPRQVGSNCLVFMWLWVIVGPRLGWPRHFSTDLPKPVTTVTMRWGKWGGEAEANDIKTSMAICLNGGW